jgi:uncharacterized MnhB-related membrane protein
LYVGRAREGEVAMTSRYLLLLQTIVSGVSIAAAIDMYLRFHAIGVALTMCLIGWALSVFLMTKYVRTRRGERSGARSGFTLRPLSSE